VEITPELRRKNRTTALVCLAFVAAVYGYAMQQLKKVRAPHTL
jgi:hypothetical protein